MRHLIRLSAFYGPYRGQLSLAAFSVFAAGAFGMLSPLLVNYAVEYGLNPQYEGDRIVGIDGDYSRSTVSSGGKSRIVGIL